MIVTQRGFLDFLGMGETRFLIPPYQRIYSWNASQCEELWLDVLRAGRADRNHFLGTVLYSRSAAAEGMDVLEFIDGQQRVTSVSLIVLALARHVRDAAAAGADVDRLEDRCLFVDDPAGKGKIARFTPSRSDAEAYACELQGTRPERMTAITRNLDFFLSKMQQDDFDPSTLVRGLERLMIISVEVEDASEAQSIFEGINSKGVPLNLADMVRNYLLLSEDHDRQTYLYNEYWAMSQEMFAPDPGSLRLNTAIKSWLSIRLKGARILSPEQTYSSFKKYVEDVYQGDKEPILRELRGFCLMWAENYRYHGVKKFKSGSNWAELGAPAITAGRKLKKADNEEYAERVRRELRETDMRW